MNSATATLENESLVVPTRLRRWWESRIGYRLFFEIGLLYGLFFVYKLVRHSAGSRVSSAFENGKEIVHLEQVLGIFTEVELQRLALSSQGFVKFLNQYYLLGHFSAAMITFLWMYTRHPAGYAKIRRVLITLTLLGLAVHIAYPLAPPRMLTDIGFVDTAKVFGPDTYGENSSFRALANQFAAMPSMHFGWAVLIAWGAVRYSRSRFRALVVLHPVLTLAAIVLTANHYWLDAVVAAVLLVVAFRIDPWVSRLRFRRIGRHTMPSRSHGMERAAV